MGQTQRQGLGSRYSTQKNEKENWLNQKSGERIYESHTGIRIFDQSSINHLPILPCV